jgi:ABC-type transport system involved in multi-copper enzyme maturation permease subunit
MSTAVNPSGEPIAARSKTESGAFLNKLEKFLATSGERLNPILVKEARQALKSRQFLMTFTALLLCGWGWSFLGTVVNMPRIYYAPSGVALLAGYYIILAVPLLIIVPFSAFRSLSAEQEDGTYELLSITTLSARQIVTGKLGSAILQMIVYYSALAPCMAFTYLLRGVDILTIALFLFYTFLASVLFSAIGLMFASLSSARSWQMFMTVCLLFALVGGAFGWFALFFEIIDEMDRAPYDKIEFWITNAIIVTAYASYLAIVILVAAGQNSFASDNRSTRVRIALFLQTVLFAGWVVWGWKLVGQWQMLVAMFMVGAAHWYVYGIFLTGESGIMSPRVKRDLPITFLGRMLFTWFNPGSGTGYIFAVCSVMVLGICAAGGLIIQEVSGIPAPPRWGSAIAPGHAYEAIAITVAYFAFYLGAGRLILLTIPNRERHGPALPIIIHLLVAFVAVAAPFTIQALASGVFGYNYTLIQITNWIWTIAESADNGIRIAGVSIIVVTAGLMMFLINLVLAAREIETVRLDTPERVQRDDADRDKHRNEDDGRC